jgi:hypothetical protein
MNIVINQFDSLNENEINNTASGYQLLEKHQKSKKGKTLICIRIFLRKKSHFINK